MSPYGYYGSDYSSNDIYHYGRKGMKWGQHIFTKIKKSSDKRKKHKAREESERNRANKVREENRKRYSKPVSEMTDAELRQAVNRLQLEKQLRDLTPKQTSRGEQFIKFVGNDVLLPSLKTSGRTVLTKYLTSQGTKLVTNSQRRKK